MQHHALEEHIDDCLKLAMHRCGNIDEAQELCQQTMLAALDYLASGREIHDMRAWLAGVLSRKFYDALRRKYKLPTVSMEDIEGIPDDDPSDAIADEAEVNQLRRQIAYLSRTYREVIVRHHLNGESVQCIAKALSLPEGTVKSRLSSGRWHIKKGFDDMENYTAHSYAPHVLHVGISGVQGLRGEPYSITENNLIAQNLLLLAYEKPVTEAELAKTIGIPAAYVEPVIDMLVNAELMKRVGHRVYTDFIIVTHKESEDSIEPQQKLIDEHFDALWQPLQTGLCQLDDAPFYQRLSEGKRHKLAYYFVMHTLSQCFFGAGARIYNPEHPYPQRPDGGKWVASGFSYPQNYDDTKLAAYRWSGERTNEVHGYLDTKEITLKVFDTPLEKLRYFHTSFDLKDDMLAKMLYTIDTGIP